MDLALNKMFLQTSVPNEEPVIFKPELVPQDMLLHSGIFSPDLREYYYTVSDKYFQQFDVYLIRQINGAWTEPEVAFFNSEYFEHGTSFSPDGEFVYFSSTRPVAIEGVASSWHIWRCKKVDGGWSPPEFVDIPNMRQNLVSHPTLTKDGTLYFHAGNVDYSEISIYSAKNVSDGFAEVVKLPPTINLPGKPCCTPYVAPDESFLLFEAVPDLYVSFLQDGDTWGEAQLLPKAINTDGRGNPYMTPDGKFLFYAAGKDPNPDEIANWSIYWVRADALLNELR